MKIRTCLLIVYLFAGLCTHAQVAFNTTGASPDNTAMLDVTSTTKGILVPRMTTAARIAITLPATGLLVYDNSLSLFYYYNGTRWVPIVPLTNGWLVNGNSGTVSGTHFLGTVDSQTLDIKTRNVVHARIRTNGQIEVLNTGQSIYMGERAGLADDFLNNHYNVGIGTAVMQRPASAMGNTSVGFASLQNATNTSSYNTCAGYFTMGNNGINGTSNTALGETALLGHTDGSYNTALGERALSSNTTGNYNVGIGYSPLNFNNEGSENTAIGRSSLSGNRTGNYNTGVGNNTLNANTTGSNNVAIGGYANATSYTLTNAIAIGYSASVTQNNNIVLGKEWLGATKTGVGTATPLSNLDITGTVGMTIKSGQVAGTDNPDNTASFWLYTAGTGTITLPAATDYANRIFTIVNRTGATVNISSYNDLAGIAQTTQPAGISMMIVSDGTNWLRIR